MKISLRGLWTTCVRAMVVQLFMLSFLKIPACSLASTKKDFLQHHCSGHIILSEFSPRSLRLDLTPEKEYTPLINCYVTVHVQEHMRIVLSFLTMNIRSYGPCAGDYLQIFDSGHVTNDSFNFGDYPKSYKYCGTQIPPAITSSRNNITLRFVSDAHFHDRGFSVMLTAFHDGQCNEGEYKCDNERCVDRDLYCDDVDNCGDGSDESDCGLPIYVIVGIVLTLAVALVAVLVLVAVVRYRCTRNRERGRDRQVMLYCDPDCLSRISKGARYLSATLSRFMPATRPLRP